MPDYFYLTQKDRDLLDKLATIFKGHVTPNRQANPEDAIPKSPDVYIALVPAGGIPAAQNNAEDDEPELVEGDRPGSAECDIYRIINGELKIAGSKRLVFNITSSVVEEGWIAVQRDKYGTWLADVGGSGCDIRNEKWLISFKGTPDTGSFDIYIPINGVIEPVTINFDSTAVEAKAAFAAHTELLDTDIVTEGGPLPESSINVEFVEDQAGKSIIPTRIDKTALTSASEEGIGVDIYRWVPGFPN